MSIKLILPDMESGNIWTYGAEFFTRGDLAGYIQGEVNVLCGENQEAYWCEFLFRVCDPENGEANRMVSFSETPTEIQKSYVDSAFEKLTAQLVWWSNMADLRSAIGLETPDEISYIDIKEDTEHTPPTLETVINGDTGYPLDGWTIADAVADYCTPESAFERDIAMRRAWGYYD